MHKGWPDFLAVKIDEHGNPTEWKTREVKSETDKLSYEQSVVNKILTMAGIICEIQTVTNHELNKHHAPPSQTTLDQTNPNHSAPNFPTPTLSKPIMSLPKRQSIRNLSTASRPSLVQPTTGEPELDRPRTFPSNTPINMPLPKRQTSLCRSQPAQHRPTLTIPAHSQPSHPKSNTRGASISNGKKP